MRSAQVVTANTFVLGFGCTGPGLLTASEHQSLPSSNCLDADTCDSLEQSRPCTKL
jgi:hypothetical protein